MIPIKSILISSLALILWFLVPSAVSAYQVSDDPQYLIINIADFYFADWTADEADWQSEVKPELLETINQIEAEVGTGSAERQLAWSTLLEYTDFPQEDVPKEQQRHVLQTQRILELAEDSNLPVFMPLNGYQWWNQLPELWNHWDDDGNQTPGCENDSYDQVVGYAGEDPIYSCKMPLLRDPEFRQRFIDGYDPENKWNVEWQDWETPMKLNYRNWGGGGFQLAPPPNILSYSSTKESYVDVQMERYQDIVSIISEQLDDWQAEGNEHLFAGLAIGTEVSLNASVLPEDEFEPYGYRSIQDLLCGAKSECDQQFMQLNQIELHQLRQKVVHQYLRERSKLAVETGIPKQRVYTHVWSEAERGEPRYTNYFEASLNYYARPTLSLYGQAQDPLAFSLLNTALKEYGQPAWGAAEFSTDKTIEAWQKALNNTMANSTNPAQIINVYNWREHVDTPAVGQIKAFLAQDPQPFTIYISEIFSKPVIDDFFEYQNLEWVIHNPEDDAVHQELLIYRDIDADFLYDSPEVISLDVDQTAWDASQLSPGVYTWVVMRSSEDGVIRRYTVPQKVLIPLEISYTNAATRFWMSADAIWQKLPFSNM